LLSLPGLVSPTYLIDHPAGGATPLVSARPVGYTPSQIRHAYEFDQIPLKGAGQTIAIVDAYDDPNIAGDLHAFDQQFGLADPVLTRVNQSGGTCYPASDPNWAVEISLDVVWAHAIAPGARILLVEANSNSYSDFLAAVDYARNQAGVSAVSMSCGSPEFSSENDNDAHLTTPSGHAGVTFVTSSGDAGTISYPAASPVSALTIMDLAPITIIDGSRGLQRAVVPVASSLRSRIVVPFPLVSRWRNGERIIDLAQALVDHGTSFCVEPRRSCSDVAPRSTDLGFGIGTGQNEPRL
jgi:hypothetical protein